MIEFKDLAGLSKPLTRLIEVISEGVGAVFRPYLTKKNAEAKAHEIRVISKALQNVANEHGPPVNYKEGSIEAWQRPEDRTLALNTLSVQDRISLRLDYQEQKRQRNIETITSIAAVELSREEEVPDKRPDEDWVTRFFNSAQDISSDQMQDLWGRVLAGEIKKPGTYSLKTLEFIRNITQADASIFENVGKIATLWNNNAFIAAHDEKWLQEKRQIYFSHLLAIGEMGGMYPTGLGLNIFREDSIQEELFISGDLMLLVKREGIKGKIELPVWKFTAVGRELLELIPSAHDEAYLESVGKFFKGKKGIAFLTRIVERSSNGNIRYKIVREI